MRLLHAQNLHIQIGQHLVCHDLEIQVAQGENLVILGRNGAGKSTLLSTLAGITPPLSGQILLQGRSYAAHGPKMAARLRAWLGQHQGTPFTSTVLESVMTGRHPHLERWQWEGQQDYAIGEEALHTVGLATLKHRDVQTLSGGERQRLGIATLLTQQTPLMLLDEPLTHLDLNYQIAVLELLQARQQAGAGLIMVLHDPGLAWRYGSRILLLYGDGSTETGTPDELLTSEKLSRLYGHPLERVEHNRRIAFIPV